ncbi:Carbohydrate esterase 4 protein [Linnemannia gamsii]|uniref:Carbohydrate esterase 4 protein n=1 Tax=Linnemannia gamsii TaxID=64522 RepID=A0A9P6QWX0_9FUNG|nr:Carbohydrate esterase 4 protein [Linnemannia gamsii]
MGNTMIASLKLPLNVNKASSFGISIQEILPSESESALDSRISSAAPDHASILSLMHDVYQATAEQVLPYAIKKLQAAGYKLVTLSECVGMKPYLSVQAPSVRDSTWIC